MIWHVLCALVLLFYLEISGQYILYKLNKNDYPLSFGFGLIFLLGYCYITTSILTFLNCRFIVIETIYSIYILISLILLIKDFKKVNWHFDYKDWVIAIIFVGVMIYYAWNTTLGDLSGFDTTYYLNMVSANSVNDVLNQSSMYWGFQTNSELYSTSIKSQYTFQSYYYFLSYFIHFAYKVLNRVTVATNTSIMIWVFQIIFNFFFVSLLINGARRINNDKKLFKYVMLFIFLFFYGKIYYNNVFGFYGNSYKTIAISYGTLCLFELSRNRSKENWLLFGMSLLSACACSSSAVFISVFLLFSSYFSLVDKEDNLFRYYASILFFPLINLFVVVLKKGLDDAIPMSLIICAILFILNKYLIKISRINNIKLIIVILGFTFMFFMSYKVTGDVFNFDAFFNNGSEEYDMTINYFKFDSHYGRAQVYYQAFVLLLLGYACVFEFRNKIIQGFVALIIVAFNPFCCSYLYSINAVYYRAYEIIINPFTVMLFTQMLIDKLDSNYMYYGILLALLTIFSLNVDFLNPVYHHGSFIPSNNYNNLMKMSDDEWNVLEYLKNDAEYDREANPYIITTNLLTQSIMPSGRYIYGRELKINENWTYDELQIYSIFYPPDYKGRVYDEVPADYNNMALYLNNAGIKYMVVDKTKEFFNEDTGYYDYFVNEVAECGYGYSIYNNDSYELFKYWD